MQNYVNLCNFMYSLIIMYGVWIVLLELYENVVATSE